MVFTKRRWQFTYIKLKAEQCLRKSKLIGKIFGMSFPDTDRHVFSNSLRAVSENVNVKFEAYYAQLQYLV
jgi:hypothetical protein